MLALPLSDQPFPEFSWSLNGQTNDLYDVLSLNRLSGLLIIRNGEILFEKYLLGNDRHTRWMSMSMVKSMTATLIGAAIKDGHIASIDDPIVKYLPRFKNSAYDGVAVKRLLQMTSGVAWNETYTDPASDRRRMLEAQIGQQAGAILDLMAVLPEGWVKAASTAKDVAGKIVNYGYMLWPLHANSYAAIGIFGQFVFDDPDKKLVVAMWSAQPQTAGQTWSG